MLKSILLFVLHTSRDKGYSPHKLRATAATSLIQSGFSIYDVKALLDHDNVTTTQLYAAHKKNIKRDIVNNFEWLDEKEEVSLDDIQASDNEFNNNLEANDVNIDTEADIKDENQE